MTPSSPEEVLRKISSDFKNKGITHADAAEKLEFNSKQTLTNLLSSKKYLSKKQALLFHYTFGYDIDYLTTGVGDLFGPTNKDEFHGRIAYESKTKSVTVIDDTQKVDFELVINWFYQIFDRQNNKEGLEIWSVIEEFSQAKNIVSYSMKRYKGDNYEKEYNKRLFALESRLIERISDLIDSIHVDSK